MTADNSRTPRYGDDGAQFRNFRQKNKPHLALAELIGDEKETMARCAVWGVQWMSEPPGPLPEENRQNYLSRKERKTEKKKAEAKAAVLKNIRERKKRPRSSSGGEPPVLQPDGATYAPATTLPPPEPPNTQWTMPSNEGMLPAYLSWAATQTYSPPPRANWAPPTSTALDSHTPPGPTSSIPDFAHHPRPAPMGAVEVRSARVRYPAVSQTGYATTLGPSPGQATSSGMPLSGHPGANTVYPPAGASCAPEVLATQHAMPGDLYAPQAYLHRVAEQARATFPISPLPEHRPLKAPACIVPNPYCPTPGLVDRLEQYAASVPYTNDHFASQGLNATSHELSSGPEPTYVADNAYTDAQSAAPLYSGVGSGSPSMDPSPPGTWAESPVWDAMPLLPHTAPQPNSSLTAVHDSVGGTEHLGATFQDFTRGDRDFPGSPSSTIVPALTPELVDYYLKMAQQANGGYAPQAHAPTMIDDRFGVIARHGAGEQDPQDVHEMAQAVQPPQGGHSVVCWAPSSITPNVDRERSYNIGGAANNTYAYNQDAQVLYYEPAALQTTDNSDAYPPTQSSYSELPQALQYPAQALMDVCAPSNMENLATSSWSMVLPAVNVGIYTHSSRSDFGAGSTTSLPFTRPYAQGTVINERQSGVSTHLRVWSQSTSAPPQYPYDDYPPTSTISSSKTMVGQIDLTHINSQYSAIRYGHGATAYEQ